MQRPSNFAYSLAIGAAALALLAPATARANGRTPATVSVHFRPGNTQDLFVGTTFGLLISHDDGQTFHLVCEDALGYTGTYDPDYAIAKNGDLYATTFTGLQESQDGGCSWSPVNGIAKTNYVAQVAIGSDGRVWAATGNGIGKGNDPNDVYVSTDGQSFTSAGMTTQDSWYQSLEVAPSDPNRVYVTGYQLMGTNGNPQALLYRSEDGGATWKQLDVSGLAFGAMPDLYIAAVSPKDPDILFARVANTYAAGSSPDANDIVDAIYRSTDAGATWTRVLELGDTIRAFAIESDGQTVIAGTVTGGVKISTDGGKTFTTTLDLPMACVGQRSDGTLFACGDNYAKGGDGALARSKDAQSWTKVMTFDQIAGPLACSAGTVQHDTCDLRRWPMTCVQLGACSAGPDAGSMPDAAPTHDSGGGGKGCGGCSISLGMVLVVLPWRRRRRGRRRRA